MLESRLQQLEDDLALRKLIAAYTRTGDAFEWQAWSELFTPDAVFTVPGAFGILRGRQEIHDIPKSKIDGVFHTTQHCIVNLDFDVQGDTAKGTGSLIYTAVADPAKPNEYYMAGGRYQWSFARTQAGWRIAKAHLDFLWNNGSGAESVFVEDPKG
ncbi:MAG: nuclear transport factor 2 family protein [Steroidobacteraceae bacterium]